MAKPRVSDDMQERVQLTDYTEYDGPLHDEGCECDSCEVKRSADWEDSNPREEEA